MKNCLFLLLAFNLLRAQQIDWSKNAGNVFLREIYAHDQKVFLAGETCSSDNNCGLVLSRYSSSSGQYESGASTAGALAARCAGVLPDNGGNLYTVLGSAATGPVLIDGTSYTGEVHLIKYNAQNEAVWVKELPFCYPDVLHYDQNGYICLGAGIASQNGGYQITRYDNAGNLLKTHVFNEGDDFNFDGAGNLYILGKNGLSKYDPDGNLLWKHICSGTSMAVEPGGACYLSLPLDAVKSVLRKLDLSGQIAWNKILPCPAGFPLYADATQNVYMAGMYTYPPHGDQNVTIVKYNSSDSLWSIRVGSSYNCLPSAITMHNNQIYVAVNSAYNPSFGNSFIVKISEPLMTDITEINKAHMFTVSPNPGTGLFRVNYEAAVDKACDLNVYDIHGACLFHQKYQAGSATQEIDLSGFHKGVYVLEIINTSKKETRKLIIE